MKFPPYTAYGARAGHLTAICLGFNGESFDPILGGYALGLGYRMYSPSLMRFLSPDTLSPFGKGGHHTYAYCNNDPVNHVDRTGHMRTPSPYARRPETRTIQRRPPPRSAISSKSTSSSRSVSTNSVDIAGVLSGYTGQEIDFPLVFYTTHPPLVQRGGQVISLRSTLQAHHQRPTGPIFSGQEAWPNPVKYLTNQSGWPRRLQ